MVPDGQPSAHPGQAEEENAPEQGHGIQTAAGTGVAPLPPGDHVFAQPRAGNETGGPAHRRPSLPGRWPGLGHKPAMRPPPSTFP